MTTKFNDLIFYEIYPTSFKDSNNDGVGDFKGISEKLDYVASLGCNAIWLNPFYVSPFMDGGYDVADFFDVDPKFGKMKDFDKMLAKAHSLGIKIIIDLVVGHASEKNKDFLESAKPTRNEKSDLFIWNNCVWDFEQPYRLISGRHQRNACYMVNFFSGHPAFNYGFKEVKYPKWQMSYKDKRTFAAREYMINVAKFWLKKGVDGFRVDMADSLVKEDEDKSATIEVWKYMFKSIHQEYPDAIFIAEWSNPQRAFEAGFDCDFVLDHWDNFYHRLVRSTDFSRGPSVFHGAEFEYFLTDIKERFAIAKSKKKLLGIISGNHDSTRIANFLSEDELKLWYLIMYTLPGIPFLYYGDEIGMKHKDIDSKDGGYQRTADRTPMQWDNSKNAGFSKTNKSLYLPVFNADQNTVESQVNDSNSLLNYIKDLISLRKNNSDLTSDAFDIKENHRIMTIKRGKLSSIINLSNTEVEVKNVLFSSKVKIEEPQKKYMLKPGDGVITN